MRIRPWDEMCTEWGRRRRKSLWKLSKRGTAARREREEREREEREGVIGGTQNVCVVCLWCRSSKISASLEAAAKKASSPRPTVCVCVLAAPLFSSFCRCRLLKPLSLSLSLSLLSQNPEKQQQHRALSLQRSLESLSLSLSLFSAASPSSEGNESIHSMFHFPLSQLLLLGRFPREPLSAADMILSALALGWGEIS